MGMKNRASETSRGKWIVILAWFLLYFWRPAFLGLYSDDWSYSVASWHSNWTSMAPRPVLACLIQVFTMLCGARPWLGQSLAALIRLAAALALRALTQGLLESKNTLAGALSAADFVALAWISFPWMLGSTAWPTCSLNQFSVVGCCIGTLALFRDMESRDIRFLILGCGLIFAGGLTYEAFLITPPLLLAWRISLRGRQLCPHWKRTLFFCALSQVVLVVYNRIASLVPGAVYKSFHGGWINLAFTNLRAIKDLPRDFGHIGIPMMPALLFLLAVGFLPADGNGIRRYLTGIAVAAGGLLSSAFLYAGAGYFIRPQGPESRTTIASSLWIALLIGSVVAQAIEGGKRTKFATTVGLALFLCSAYLSSVVAATDWTAAWSREQSILREVPTDGLANMRSGDMLVVDLPKWKGSVPDFGDAWGISGALQLTYPASICLRGNPAIVARGWEFMTRWEHGLLSQSRCSGGGYFRCEDDEGMALASCTESIPFNEAGGNGGMLLKQPQNRCNNSFRSLFVGTHWTT
jgi:hypothetical protein